MRSRRLASPRTHAWSLPAARWPATGTGRPEPGETSVIAEATPDRHRVGQRRSADRSPRFTPGAVVSPAPIVVTAVLRVVVVVAGAHRPPQQRATECEREEV